MADIPTIDELIELSGFTEEDFSRWFSDILAEIGALLRENAKKLLMGELVAFCVDDENGKWDDKGNYSDKFILFKNHHDKIQMFLSGKEYSVSLITANTDPCLIIRRKK